MKMCFVSNYINHHQIPFCDAMYRMLDGEFCFLQTEKMAQERRLMGWQAEARPEYVHCYYEEEEFCRLAVQEADVALFGGCDDESYITDRLRSGRPVIRISERLYKTGQWKAVSPRGLWKKYCDHTRYRNAPVYLLCAGAYTASDFEIVRAYRGRRYCWGYFPETRTYGLEQLFAGKGYGSDAAKTPYLLWAGRFIDWKHPELALETARFLRERGHVFHMDIIGGGDMEPRMRELLEEYRLSGCVSLLGFCPPEEVRAAMEKADIYLFTSDREEGWGAVLNEAMNSGCAVAADHMIGAVPYLIRHGKNGYIYEDGKPEELFRYAEELLTDAGKRRAMGAEAYRTITDTWNAENAARQLLQLIAGEGLAEGEWPVPGGCQATDDSTHTRLRPCAPAPLLRERRACARLKGGGL